MCQDMTWQAEWNSCYTERVQECDVGVKRRVRLPESAVHLTQLHLSVWHSWIVQNEQLMQLLLREVAAKCNQTTGELDKMNVRLPLRFRKPPHFGASPLFSSYWTHRPQSLRRHWTKTAHWMQAQTSAMYRLQWARMTRRTVMSVLWSTVTFGATPPFP